MSIVVTFVGLDYHKDSIRVCILDESGEELFNRNCPNDVEAVAEKVAQFGQPAAVAIEACCGAADFADQLQQRYDWNIKLAHPGYVHRLKKSPDKSDKSDGFLLADLVRVDYLPEVWLAPLATRQLRRLVRFRQQLKLERTEVKQQIQGLLSEERALGAPANPWTKAWLAWLNETAQLGEEARWVLQRQLARLQRVEEEIQAVDKRLGEVTQEDPVYQKLLQQPGVGPVTAATLRAQIGSFDRFQSGKQLARYCGVTPCNASTGKRQADAGLVRASNKELRTILLETAHRLARYDERWKQLKSKLVRRNKPGSVAAAAVANRWVRWLYHQMVSGKQLSEAA
jgi:transposase